jgi:NAD(P)H-hydrate epimerase
MWIATAQQMRRIDRRALDEFGIPTRALVERAGHAVFGKLQEILSEPGSIAVVCGKGHNGADGLVLARLAHEAGYLVDCLIAATREELSEVSSEALRTLVASGLGVTFADSEYWVAKLQALAAHDLIVDAILGIGAKERAGESSPVTEAIHAVNRAETFVLAIDVPSGIECDRGVSTGAAVVADATVTFGLPKPFLFAADGLEMSGTWSLADIGLPATLLAEPAEAMLLDFPWIAERMPVRRIGSHKGENGHVLIVAGSSKMRGAAVLCARSALRAGAGLVTVASVPEVCDAVAAQLPEALLLPLPEANGAIAPAAAEQILAHGADVGLFGPGLSQAEPVRELLANVYSRWDRPALVDADALTIGSGMLPSGPCVLTPHPGELGRMMGMSASEIESDRFRAVESARERFGQTVLLKGAHSIVATTGEPLYVNSTGNVGLATGGSGDVLSGVIASLLAQGLTPVDAAVCGMFWHGFSADLCAEKFGSVGYSPSEVAMLLPLARDTIFEKCNSVL